MDAIRSICLTAETAVFVVSELRINTVIAAGGQSHQPLTAGRIGDLVQLRLKNLREQVMVIT